jgi:hypothetical protein
MIKSSALENIGDDSSAIPASGGLCLDWAITVKTEYEQRASGGARICKEISRRWFLDATVDAVFFKHFCAALEKVGVTPMGLGGPAVFHRMDAYSVDGLKQIKFQLEALDLRLVPERHQLDQLGEDYFLIDGARLD